MQNDQKQRRTLFKTTNGKLSCCPSLHEQLSFGLKLVVYLTEKFTWYNIKTSFYLALSTLFALFPQDSTMHILICFSCNSAVCYVHLVLILPVSSWLHLQHICLSNHPPRLYQKLLKVAERGHQKAQEKVATAMLFGDYMNQNVTKAKEMFETLATDGSPKAQMVQSSYKTLLSLRGKMSKAVWHLITRLCLLFLRLLAFCTQPGLESTQVKLK